MQFKRSPWDNENVDTVTEMIESDIRRHDSDRGALEDAEYRIDRIAQILGYITQQLSPEAIKNVAKMMDWEVLEP